MKRILLTVIFMVALAMPATLIAGVPQLINYQGRLTNSAGNPLDTTVSITFSIYTDSVGGTPIWTETHPSVSVVNGLFSVILGSLTKSAWILCWDPLLGWVECGDYMGITVGASPEITPRTRLTSSMYSIISGHVSSLDSAKGGTIIGGFAIVGDESAPKGLSEFMIGGATQGIWWPNPGLAPYPGKISVRNITNAKNIELDGTTGMATVKGFTMSTGAGTDLVLTSDATGVGTWKQGASDLDWDKDLPLPSTKVLFTHGAWGIARLGNTLWGNAKNTHVNLGLSCITGRNGQDYESAVIAGGVNNQAIGHFTTIGGGHSNIIGNNNNPSGDEARLATIAGGYSNEAHAWGTSVGGGEFNIAYDAGCAISGGYGNQAGLSGSSPTEQCYAFIGGGLRNLAQGYYSTIGGGYENHAVGIKSTIGGGDSNYVSLEKGTIGGGHHNEVTNYAGTIAGGEHDTVLAPYGTVGGGNLHLINSGAYWGTIAGGTDNNVQDSAGAILGGAWNTTSASFASIGGGRNNSADGQCAAIPGGSDNKANGHFSLAAGQQAQALNDGSFVWNENSAGIFASTASNQFLIHASGGTGVHTNAPNSTIDINGSMAMAVTIVNTTPYTPGWNDCVLKVTRAGATTINLPAAAGVTGRIYYIKNMTGAPGYGVTIDPNGAETIDDSAALTMTAKYQSMIIVSDGTGWLIVGQY